MGDRYYSAKEFLLNLFKKKDKSPVKKDERVRWKLPSKETRKQERDMFL